MKKRLLMLQKRSLAASTALAIVILASPTGTVAAPSCEKNPTHPNCDDGGGGESGDLYTVEVYLADDVGYAGRAENVPGSGNETRPKVGDVGISLDLTRLSMVLLGTECATDFGNVTLIDGEFVVSTARIPKSGPFTFVTASFWNFIVNGSTYTVIFGPDDDGTIDDETNWPPAGSTGDSNFLSGEWLLLQVQNGSANRGPCDELMVQLNWRILVIKE